MELQVKNQQNTTSCFNQKISLLSVVAQLGPYKVSYAEYNTGTFWFSTIATKNNTCSSLQVSTRTIYQEYHMDTLSYDIHSSARTSL